MSLRVLAAAFVGLAISIIGVVMVIGIEPAAVSKNPNKVNIPVIEPPVVAKSGPQPKVSVSETEIEFGRMEVGESRSHDFVFTNVGEAPLTIKMGDTTCQCTYGDLQKGEERKILPGQSQNVKLTWKPEVQTEHFSKGANILTDDPTQKSIGLKIVGIVGSRIAVIPDREWPCPDVLDDKAAHCTGMLVSGVLKDFKVSSIETHGAPIEFELSPLDESQLQSQHASAGYQVRLTVKPEIQTGAFAIPITIKTNVPEKSESGDAEKLFEFNVLISGVRRGPIRFAGPEWIEDKMAIRLGSFEASEGKQLLVPMFIRNPPADGFQLTKAPETTPSELKVELVRDDKSEGKAQRYFLKLDYPAGAPRVEHRIQDPGKIRLFTNHPHASEIELIVYLAAF
jgi:hypothetical protein